MEPEKLLPPGEPVPKITPNPEMRIHRKPVEPATIPTVPEHTQPAPERTPEKAPIPALFSSLPETTEAKPAILIGKPSQKQQSWGVVISIVIIVMMIVTGAFYSWGKRIAEERALEAQSAVQ